MKAYILQRVDGDARCFVEVKGGGYFLDPKPSQQLRNHSPNGFEYGYSGSGPAQLALAILLDWTRTTELPAVVAMNHYQDFKEKFIASGTEGTRITTKEIETFCTPLKL